MLFWTRVRILEEKFYEKDLARFRKTLDELRKNYPDNEEALMQPIRAKTEEKLAEYGVADKWETITPNDIGEWSGSLKRWGRFLNSHKFVDDKTYIDYYTLPLAMSGPIFIKKTFIKPYSNLAESFVDDINEILFPAKSS